MKETLRSIVAILICVLSSIMIMPGLIKQDCHPFFKGDYSSPRNDGVNDFKSDAAASEQTDTYVETKQNDTEAFMSETDYYRSMVAAVEREKKKAAERTDRDIPFVSQLPDFPNGCEAACAVMLLNYFGYDVTLSDFIALHLPCCSIYMKDGIMYGPDPSRSFAGDPSDKCGGFGCFAPVINESIRRVLSQAGDNSHSPIDLSGKTLDELYSFLPCIIWITTDYSEAKEVIQWQSYDGIQSYSYPLKQHAVILKAGSLYDYSIIDPLKTGDEISISKDQLEACFDSMGRQAVTVITSLME